MVEVESEEMKKLRKELAQVKATYKESATRLDDIARKLEPSTSNLRQACVGFGIGVATMFILLMAYSASGIEGFVWPAFAYYIASLVFLCVFPLVCGYVVSSIKDRH